MEDKEIEEPEPGHNSDNSGDQGITYVIDEYWDNYFRLYLGPGVWLLGSC